jgi:hypothetical protein
MRQGSKAERADRQVAKQGNVSEGYVHAAQKIKDKLPEIFEMVKADTVSIPEAQNPEVIAHGYFGAVDSDSEDRILRPASVYCPKKRTVAIESKVTGTHIPPSCANCRVI